VDKKTIYFIRDCVSCDDPPREFYLSVGWRYALAAITISIVGLLMIGRNNTGSVILSMIGPILYFTSILNTLREIRDIHAHHLDNTLNGAIVLYKFRTEIILLGIALLSLGGFFYTFLPVNIPTFVFTITLIILGTIIVLVGFYLVKFIYRLISRKKRVIYLNLPIYLQFLVSDEGISRRLYEKEERRRYQRNH